MPKSNPKVRRVGAWILASQLGEFSPRAFPFKEDAEEYYANYLKEMTIESYVKVKVVHAVPCTITYSFPKPPKKTE